MGAASIRTSLMVGAAGALVAALIAPAAAAPTLSANAAVKAAADRAGEAAFLPCLHVPCGRARLAEHTTASPSIVADCAFRLVSASRMRGKRSDSHDRAGRTAASFRIPGAP